VHDGAGRGVRGDCVDERVDDGRERRVGHVRHAPLSPAMIVDIERHGGSAASGVVRGAIQYTRMLVRNGAGEVECRECRGRHGVKVDQAYACQAATSRQRAL
jgi:hypothetical protein